MIDRAPAADPGWRLPLAGAVALLLGVGLGRYAFTPLITPLVEQHWFSDAQTARLGAINLLGYLCGAATAHRIGRRFGERRTIAVCLATVVASLFACALDWGMVWYAPWRLVAGWAAATLTIVVTPAIMARMPARARPRSSAVIFTGIGVGTIASSLIVPWLADAGIAAAWCAVGVVGGLLAAWSWFAVWRSVPDLPASETRRAHTGTTAAAPWLAITLIVVAYGLSSAGYVPHSLYWVDYIARELGRGLGSGSAYWLLLGIGGVVGPAAAGVTAARLGFRPALIAAFVLMTAATALPLASTQPWALTLSSLFVGAMVPAIITLTAGVVVDLVPTGRQQQIWGWATLSFAATQAVGGFVMARLYAQIGRYIDLIGMGAAILVIGCACAIAGAVAGARASR